VADTPIGRIGCAICYDWLFPEAIRQLAANGAEVLMRVSAYMDPWGATEPMNWWTLVNRLPRPREHGVSSSAANQGASLRHYPPYSWPGGSQVVDFDGVSSPKRLPDPASASSSRRSTSRRCGTSARRAEAITCWRTCAARRTRVRGAPVSSSALDGVVVRAECRIDRAREGGGDERYGVTTRNGRVICPTVPAVETDHGPGDVAAFRQE